MSTLASLAYSGGYGPETGIVNPERLACQAWEVPADVPIIAACATLGLEREHEALGVAVTLAFQPFNHVSHADVSDRALVLHLAEVAPPAPLPLTLQATP